jgi:hypothetical protein
LKKELFSFIINSGASMNIAYKLIDFVEDINIKNRNRNIFYKSSDGRGNLTLPGTVFSFISNNRLELKYFFSGVNGSAGSYFTDIFSGYSARRMLRTLSSMNQYITIDEDVKRRSYELYRDFIEKMAAICSGDYFPEEKEVASVVTAHQEGLKNILLSIEEIRSSMTDERFIKPLPCSEYSPVFQLAVLGVSLEEIREPVLDIGCGYKGDLVKYLLSRGIEAYGFDRIVEEDRMLENADWLKKEYGVSRWGTVISHLAFSNHFYRAHFKKSESYIAYSKKYIEILSSLKKDGIFVYAPGLPFIECFLDNDKYDIQRFTPNGIPADLSEKNLYSVKIRKK